MLFIGISLSFIYSVLFFFFKQKTAYEMRISDWSSDVCSSDLRPFFGLGRQRNPESGDSRTPNLRQRNPESSASVNETPNFFVSVMKHRIYGGRQSTTRSILLVNETHIFHLLSTTPRPPRKFALPCFLLDIASQISTFAVLSTAAPSMS